MTTMAGSTCSSAASSTPGTRRAAGSCRLYHNEHNGTFEDVAESAGVTNERYAKGSAWGDYDGDGRLDLFVSNMGQECRLYHNEGDGQFRDVGRKLGVTGGESSFSCWFWDYDNDGWLDLFVNDYKAGLADVVAHYIGIPVQGRGASPALPQPRGQGLSRRQHRGGSRSADHGHGRELRRYRQRRLPRRLLRDRTDDLLGAGAERDAQERRTAAASRTSPIPPGRVTCRRATASRSPTGIATATSTSSSSSAGRSRATRPATRSSRTRDTAATG